MVTAADMPAARVSSVWISEGTWQSEGKISGGRKASGQVCCVSSVIRGQSRQLTWRLASIELRRRHNAGCGHQKTAADSTHQPAEGSPGPRKAGHKDADDDQHSDGHVAGQHIVVLWEFHRQHHARDDLRSGVAQVLKEVDGRAASGSWWCS